MRISHSVAIGVVCLGLGLLACDSSARAQAPSGAVATTNGPAALPSATLEVRGPGAPALRRSIEARLAGVASLRSGAPAILGPLGPVGGGSAAPADLSLRVRLRGRGANTRALIDVATGDGAPLLSRTLPGVAGDAGREAVASAVLDAVRDGRVAAASRRSALRDEAARRQRRDAAVAAERAQREQAAIRLEEARWSEQRPRLRALGALSLRSRTLDILLAGGDETIHETGPFAELGLVLEARPFATSRAWTSGLYAELFGAAAVGLSAASENGGNVAVGAYRLLGSVGYRYPAGILELGGSVGFGLDTVSLADNDYAPSTSYGYLRTGPSVRLALLPAGRLHARVELGLRFPLGAGRIGDVYGPASAFGYDASAGIEGQLGRLALGVSFGLAHFDLSWSAAGAGGTGDTAPAPAEPGLGAEAATSAADVSVHVMATAGYRIF